MEVDKYISATRSHLKLVRQVLEQRLLCLEKLPKGIVIRNNQIRHTRTMLVLVLELEEIAAHDPDKWYDVPPGIPF